MRRFAGSLLLVLAACGRPTTPRTSDGDDEARVKMFETAEDEILYELAALDRRLAKRARIEPREEDLGRVAMGAILTEDPTLVVIGGAIDPFSFDARARGLAALKKKLASLPSRLPVASEGMTPLPALERELLTRLVDEELLRLEEERALPRSASALVRTVVETWTAPRSPEEAAGHDRWLARRLEEIRVALEKGSLDPVRARELDDALDDLERLTSQPGFTTATQKLLALREALEAQAGGRNRAAASEGTDLEKRIRAHLGSQLAVEDIEARLARALVDAASRVKAAREAAHFSAEALAARSHPLLFLERDCIDTVPGSRVRSMAPAPERRPSCHLRHDLAAASNDADLAVAWAQIHDHVVVGLWALDVARGTATLNNAIARRHLVNPPSPETQARLERIALVRPVAAIGAGLTAALLLGADDSRARAIALAAIGEVPLDIAERELDRRGDGRGVTTPRPAVPANSRP